MGRYSSAKENYNTKDGNFLETKYFVDIFGAASIISYVVAREQVATDLATWMTAFCASKYTFLFLVNIMILLFGMFIDTSIIQLVFVPLLFPVVRYFDINMICFGLIVTFNMMVGLYTPPFGMLLFITFGISDTPLKGVMKEILWPICVMLIYLAIGLILYYIYQLNLV